MTLINIPYDQRQAGDLLIAAVNEDWSSLTGWTAVHFPSDSPPHTLHALTWHRMMGNELDIRSIKGVVDVAVFRNLELITDRHITDNAIAITEVKRTSIEWLNQWEGNP